MSASDRRLTFTQTPFSEQYIEKLSGATGISKAELYNTAVQALAVLVGAHKRGTEYVIRDNTSGRTMHDPALPVILGNILTELGGDQ
ncbi:hypothetical protein [Nocardia flavorosea]|uniref:Uncharacterized protein n=1 Tax=Nocardia flavorosea TaxID=53429 RepID=A0A846YRV0_9NOCA|nr:hypothetical protein [Nocardia flavorosea]NKY60401.1 hypothetical protein [Nocardia flavorosea]